MTSNQNIAGSTPLMDPYFTILNSSKIYHFSLKIRVRSELDKIVSLTPNLNELENRSGLNILTESAVYIHQL